MGAKYYAIELDQVGRPSFQTWHRILLLLTVGNSDDGSAIQGALAEMTGQTTVPSVWISKKHIGGNSDLQSKKGDLPELLKDAGAL